MSTLAILIAFVTGAGFALALRALSARKGVGQEAGEAAYREWRRHMGRLVRPPSRGVSETADDLMALFGSTGPGARRGALLLAVVLSGLGKEPPAPSPAQLPAGPSDPCPACLGPLGEDAQETGDAGAVVLCGKCFKKASQEMEGRP
jgi:hypothetical protein